MCESLLYSAAPLNWACTIRTHYEDIKWKDCARSVVSLFFHLRPDTRWWGFQLQRSPSAVLSAHYTENKTLNLKNPAWALWRKILFNAIRCYRWFLHGQMISSVGFPTLWLSPLHSRGGNCNGATAQMKLAKLAITGCNLSGVSLDNIM